MKPSVEVLILNWNGADLTIDCLRSMWAVNYPTLGVTVIDNGSSDDSVERILKEYPDVNMISLDQNYGYGGGYNRAIPHLSTTPDYLLLLNNDTTVAPDFIQCLVDGIEKFGGDHLYGPKIYYADQPERIWYAGGEVSMRGARIYHRGLRKIDSAEFQMDVKTGYVTGCCLLLSSDLWDKLDGFDEQFNMYAEDVDLCLRGKKQGADCYMIHSAHIWHKVSASMGGNMSLKKQWRKLKSSMYLISKR